MYLSPNEQTKGKRGIEIWLKHKKNSPLMINWNKLFHNNIYIYIYMCVCVCVCVCVWIFYSFLLYLSDRQLRYLAGAVFLYYSIFWVLGICLKKIDPCTNTWIDFLSYSPVFGVDIGYLLSCNTKIIYF